MEVLCETHSLACPLGYYVIWFCSWMASVYVSTMSPSQSNQLSFFFYCVFKAPPSLTHKDIFKLFSIPEHRWASECAVCDHLYSESLLLLGCKSRPRLFLGKVISLYLLSYPFLTMLATLDIFLFHEVLVFLLISWIFCSLWLYFNVTKLVSLLTEFSRE